MCPGNVYLQDTLQMLNLFISSKYAYFNKFGKTKYIYKYSLNIGHHI